MKPIIAIMYDFDKTLCTRDMQEYTFIPSVGMEPNEFWEYAGKISGKEGMDNILAYMYCMVETAKKAGSPVTREALVACGKHVEYHPGVQEWFERINAYGRESGVIIEHYVLSSGLKEIIEGTSIAQYFKRIYACEFLYRDGQAIWPKISVNYTNKTQFVYRINKGILDINNDKDLNRSLPETERRVLFPNMIYIGDGLTDVPSMKLTKLNGGMMDKLMYVCGIVGLMVIGAMVASMVGLTTPITFASTGLVLQDVLNSILPNLLNLGIVMLMYTLIRKKVKTGWLLGICIVGGVAINALGLLV